MDPEKAWVEFCQDDEGYYDLASRFEDYDLAKHCFMIGYNQGYSHWDNLTF